VRFYGLNQPADFAARDIRPEGQGMRFAVDSAAGRDEYYIPVLGGIMS
jgi:hypothetical protein